MSKNSKFPLSIKCQVYVDFNVLIENEKAEEKYKQKRRGGLGKSIFLQISVISVFMRCL